MQNIHYIGKQIVLVDAPTNKDGTQIQNQINSICQDYLFPVLEKVFNRFANEEQLININQLEVCIDKIGDKIEEEVFIKRVEQELTNQLQRIANEHSTSKKDTIHQNHFTAWLDYLKTGKLHQFNKNYIEEEILTAVLQTISTTPTAPTQLKRVLKRNEAAIQRLTKQYNTPFLIQLLEAAEGKSFKGLKSLIKETSVFLTKHVAEVQKDAKVQLVKNDAFTKRSFIWEAYIKSYLVHNGKPSAARFLKILVQTTIPKAADWKKIIQYGQQHNKRTNKLYPNIWKVINSDKFQKQLSLSKTVEGIPSEARLYPNQKINEDRLSILSSQAIKAHYHTRYLQKEEAEETQNPLSTILPISNDESIYLKDAGVILTHPFLAHLFTHIGLLENNQFIEQQAKYKAAHLIQYLANKQENRPEYEMILPKFLCGIPLSEPIDRESPLTKEDKNESEKCSRL